MSAGDEEILLVDTWMTSDHPRSLEAVVGVMKHLLERVDRIPPLEDIDADVVHAFLVGKIMPYLTGIEIDSKFDQVADLLGCVYGLLCRVLNKGITHCV